MGYPQKIFWKIFGKIGYLFVNDIIMGQRIILSEDEKRNIRVMYGIGGDNEYNLNEGKFSDYVSKFRNALKDAYDNPLTPSDVYGKIKDIYQNFNLKDIKKQLKEKLDIDENSTKLEIAQKLDVMLFKYELGASLGGFIFMVIATMLDINGVEPFVSDESTDMMPLPHLMLTIAGAILGIFRTHKEMMKDK